MPTLPSSAVIRGELVAEALKRLGEQATFSFQALSRSFADFGTSAASAADAAVNFQRALQAVADSGAVQSSTMEVQLEEIRAQLIELEERWATLDETDDFDEAEYQAVAERLEADIQARLTALPAPPPARRTGRRRRIVVD